MKPALISLKMTLCGPQCDHRDRMTCRGDDTIAVGRALYKFMEANEIRTFFAPEHIHCGSPASASAEPTPAAPTPAQPAEHWECPKCGEANRAHRSACNGCGAGKPTQSPQRPSRPEDADRAPPRFLRVTGKDERVDGLYERYVEWEGLPTWVKREGNSVTMAMYSDRGGRWAVTTPEGVARNANFMVSRVHQGQWPQRMEQWGVMREGSFQQLGRVAVGQCVDFAQGDVVYYQGQEEAFESGDRLTHGLRGEVRGLEPDGCVEVMFDGHQLPTPLDGTLLSRTPPTAGAAARYQRGEVVFYAGGARNFRSGDRLVAGLRGLVLGPEGDGRVLVKFQGHRCETPLSGSELSRADLYQPGDVVFYAGPTCTFDSGDRLRAGMRGQVIEHKEDGRVSVRFQGHRCNTPTSRYDLSKAPPADLEGDLRAALMLGQLLGIPPRLAAQRLFQAGRHA